MTAERNSAVTIFLQHFIIFSLYCVRNIFISKEIIFFNCRYCFSNSTSVSNGLIFRYKNILRQQFAVPDGSHDYLKRGQAAAFCLARARVAQQLRTASPHFTRRHVSPGTHPYTHRKPDPSLPSGSRCAGTVQGSGGKRLSVAAVRAARGFPAALGLSGPAGSCARGG